MADNNITPVYSRRKFLKAAGAAGTALSLGGVASAKPGRVLNLDKPDTGALLVGMADGMNARAMENRVTEVLPRASRVKKRNETLGYMKVEVASGVGTQSKESLMQRLSILPGVKYVEFDTLHKAFLTPNDPRFTDQYAPQQVDAPSAWDVTTGSNNVTVSVVDQGVKYDHPDLDDNWTGTGKDFVDSDGDPYPDDLSNEYHGTHVAGISAAAVDNSTGVAGQGNSGIISARALSEEGSGSTSDIADAVEWSADQGADVVNMSLGGGGYTETMKNAVSYAYNNGTFIAAAAGNDGSSSVSYPAAYDECLAVSAVDSNEQLADFSQYGSNVELCAPGVDILSTWTGDDYNRISGTSMATPVVSGVAGLTLADNSFSASELRSHLKSTAKDIGLSSDKQGSGQVNAGNALGGGGGGDGGDDGDDGGGGGGGDGKETGSVTSSLSSSWDSECWQWNWNFSSPSKVVLDLDGPSGADFDLYARYGDCPALGWWSSEYDYRSASYGSDETIEISSPDTSSSLYALVDSYSGSGSYTLTITEYE